MVSLGTSLVYGGWVYLLLLLSFGLITIINKKIKVNYFINFFVMLVGYFLSFFYTFTSLGIESHRIEIVISKNEFISTFISLLTNGYDESPYNSVIPISLLIIAMILFLIKKEVVLKYERIVKYICYSVLVIFAIVLFSAMFISCDFIINFRNMSGGIIKTIGLNRVSHFIPVFWTIIFSGEMILLSKICEYIKLSEKLKKAVIFSLIFSICFVQYMLLKNNEQGSYYKYNMKSLMHKNVDYLSYKQFFDEDTMKDIKNFINKPLESYHVVSFGLNPAIPLFSGFYCLDGYSTNYKLSYKKEFRNIIKNELEKRKDKWYFDDWGSRAYIISSKRYNFRPIDDSLSFNDKKSYNLDINYEALKNLGCKYIISVNKLSSNKLNPEHIFISRHIKGRNYYLYSIN